MSDGLTSCKVVLLGESGVGKTCIISRYCTNTFDENSISTTGASYAGKTMTFEEYGGKSIKFEIWDTAGQEKYRALTKIFYKDAAVALLVYDITREGSFEEIKNYWYSQVKEYANEDIIIALAGNKCDLFDSEQVTEEDARKYAQEIGAIFRLTSAFTNSGIDELFTSIGKKYLDPSYQDNKKNADGDDKVTLDKKKKNSEKKPCCK